MMRARDDMPEGDAADAAPELTSHRRGRQYQERRTEIVDMAAALFSRNGYDATSIRQIGEAAQLARGALYYYIDSKESLLAEIHDRVMDPLLSQTGHIISLRASATARLRMLSEVLLQLVIEYRDHVWVFLHEYRALTGERREEFRNKRVQYEKLIMQLLDEGVSRGEFDIEDVRTTMLTFVGMHNYTYTWVHSAGHVDAAKLSELYCNIFFSGIARKG
jgi:AcrR family transcriptional regulator